MTNRTLINLLQPRYTPFAFDHLFDEDDTRGSFLTNFHENEDAYFTSVDMPGVTPADINIDVEDSYIRISAERKDTFKDNLVTKRYEFTVGLPKNVDKENISAHYEQGVLNLALHKAVEDKSKKKISVSTGEKPKAWNDFLNFNKKKDDSKVDANKNIN